MVGADLEVMRRDAAAARRGRPTVLISLTEDPSATPVARRPVRRLAVSTAMAPGAVAAKATHPSASLRGTYHGKIAAAPALCAFRCPPNALR